MILFSLTKFYNKNNMKELFKSMVFTFLFLVAIALAFTIDTICRITIKDYDYYD